MHIEDVLARIRESGVVAIIRNVEAGALGEAVEALVAGGVDCMEVAMSVRGALREIALQKEKWGDRIMMGAAEVLNGEMVTLAGAAGADFCSGVSANPEMIRTCNERDLLAIPGALTPTEVHNAWHGGAGLVRVFPANLVGPGYFEAVSRVLSRVELMPAGGITAQTAGQFVRAGAVAVAAGRAIFDPAAGSFEVVAQNAARMARAVQTAREARPSDQ